MDVKRPCPVGEHALLCDEAVVAPAFATLVRNVHGTLVWAAWLVVVVGDGLVLGLPAEVRGHHPIHVDPIAELQSDGHGEPAGAQPGVGYLPVLARLLLEQLIKLQHLLPRDDIDL